ncbi:MAG: glutaredoxin 3 [Alsobacter sp.]
MVAVVIYSKSWCPYCHSAKDLLTRKGVAFEEIDVTSDRDGEAAMVKRTGRTSVPQIFIGTTHVGGCDDLYALEQAGRLDPLLAA